MGNPILETIASIAAQERRKAIREREYSWAIVAAIVETWASGHPTSDP